MTSQMTLSYLLEDTSDAHMNLGTILSSSLGVRVQLAKYTLLGLLRGKRAAVIWNGLGPREMSACAFQVTKTPLLCSTSQANPVREAATDIGQLRCYSTPSGRRRDLLIDAISVKSLPTVR